MSSRNKKSGPSARSPRLDHIAWAGFSLGLASLTYTLGQDNASTRERADIAQEMTELKNANSEISTQNIVCGALLEDLRFQVSTLSTESQNTPQITYEDDTGTASYTD